MDKQVFIINGSGGAGKDTFISLLDYKALVMNFSSVDKVKEVAKIIGWNGAKTEKDRKFLSDLKQLCTNYNDMPLNSMKEKYKNFLGTNAHFLFLHIREPEEIERAKEVFNAKTILIKRDSIKHIVSNMSDGNVYNYDYDIVINNNGDIGELRDKAICFTLDFFNGQLKNEY
jgi:hypothetical protein